MASIQVLDIEYVPGGKDPDGGGRGGEGRHSYTFIRLWQEHARKRNLCSVTYP